MLADRGKLCCHQRHMFFNETDQPTMMQNIAFLASDACSYVTGQNIRVDGGLTRVSHPFNRPK